MPIPQWPSGLPQYPERSFSESIGVNILRTPMDQGPAKVRYRSTKPQTLNVQYTLTKAQVDTLETFLVSTIKGVLRFSFPHPRLSSGTTYVMKEVRVVPQQSGDLVSLQYLAPDYYRASLQLEVLP
jgi:hypothetical protein